MAYSKSKLKGVTYYNRSKAYNGYTIASSFVDKKVRLVDMEGNIVHQWNTPFGANLSKLLPNGNLLYSSGGGRLRGPGVAYLVGEDVEESSTDLRVNSLVEVDWNNGLVWKYEAPDFSHDFNRMKNGNTIYVKYVVVPDSIKNKVKGGMEGTEIDGAMWSDAVYELSPDGEICWEWLAYEHLNPEIDIICPLEYRGEWTHMNSCHLLKNGDILATMRQTNAVYIIDKVTGDIKWRWGFDELGHPHDPTMLKNGNILVFDNGVHRYFSQELDYYSRVIEVNPVTNKIEWEYKDGQPSEFYTSVCGSAQKLPNGNVLICESLRGRIFEVTCDGEIVWEYIYPIYNSLWVYGSCNVLYRAYRYGADLKGLKAKNLDPINYEYLNRIYGSTLFEKNKQIIGKGER